MEGGKGWLYNKTRLALTLHIFMYNIIELVYRISISHYYDVKYIMDVMYIFIELIIHV